MELLDVTLREGEQRAGRSYTVDEKVTVAETLSALGVSYVQLGFPVADDGTGAACDRLSIDAKTTGIARVLERDVDAAAASGVDVIELFAPTSDRQREQLLEVGRGELRDRIGDAVSHAAETGCELHFTAMDGFRSDPDFLSTLYADLADAVSYVSIADTVGARTPAGVSDFLADLSAGVNRSRLGVHFHDDLGVATANALAAARHGVGKVDVSVAGVGERAVDRRGARGDSAGWQATPGRECVRTRVRAAHGGDARRPLDVRAVRSGPLRRRAPPAVRGRDRPGRGGAPSGTRRRGTDVRSGRRAARRPRVSRGAAAGGGTIGRPRPRSVRESVRGDREVAGWGVR